ncbi:MAG: SEL1-like repeat protein [Proteobacteria bacterium]|nr:SEL1-like repeat protein [Pseudomonadota bacterium]
MTRKIKISVLAAFLGVVAFPVQSYYQAYGFFNASNKYREWFHNTVWLQDTRVQEAARGEPRSVARNSIAVKYPYPDKKLVMTGKLWRESSRSIEFGQPDWFDAEVVRQRAEVEEYPPAMDFLAWMYEEGRGLERNFNKAFMWYERAKLAGQTNLRGSSAKIFDRLSERQQFLAQVQLAEDIQRLKPDAKVAIEGFERVKLYVMKQQRKLSTYGKNRKGLKTRPIKDLFR